MATEEKAETKPAKKSEAICPPFVIQRKVVLGETAYLPGDEDKLRPLLDAANFAALCAQGAIVRLEPKAR